MDQGATWKAPSSPSPKGAHFRSMSVVAKYHFNWYGGRPQPNRHCVKWETSLPKKGWAQYPQFWPMSVVAKRLPITATTEHLLEKAT